MNPFDEIRHLVDAMEAAHVATLTDNAVLTAENARLNELLKPPPPVELPVITFPSQSPADLKGLPVREVKNEADLVLALASGSVGFEVKLLNDITLTRRALISRNLERFVINGNGKVIKGGGLSLRDSKHFWMHHLSIQAGLGVTTKASYDCLELWGERTVLSDFLIQNSSFCWGSDENLGWQHVARGAMEACLVYECMTSGQSGGSHSMGMLVSDTGGRSEDLRLERNGFLFNQDRNPRASVLGKLELINNVVIGALAPYKFLETDKLTLAGNVQKNLSRTTIERVEFDPRYPLPAVFVEDGNLWVNEKMQPLVPQYSAPMPTQKANFPFLPALEAYEWVLDNAGNFDDDRTRIIHKARTALKSVYISTVPTAPTI